MSMRQTAESPPSKSPRKRRQAEVVSFEDVLAAHHIDREPGKLPPEGVVLIGVDRELQERMRAGFPAPAGFETAANLSEPGFGEPRAGEPQSAVPDFAEPEFTEPLFRGSDFDESDFTEPQKTEPQKTEPRLDRPERPTPPESAEIHIEQSYFGTVNPGIAIPGDINHAPQFGEPEKAAPEFGEPELAGAGISEPEIGEADFDEPEFDLDSLLQRRTGHKTYTVYPASRIEVILSTGELRLLRWYWEMGRPIPGHPHVRIVSGENGEGSRRMAAQAGLVWNTFRNYTRSLSTKYAIDVVKPDRNMPKLYVVWHYTAILERLRKAGLTGVMRKNGGCRELVDDQSRPAQPRPDLTVAELKRMLATKSGTGKFATQKPGSSKTGMPNIGAPSFGSAVQNFGSIMDKFGMPNFGSPIRNKEYTSDKEVPTPTSGSVPKLAAPKIVIDALFGRTGRTDADAARAITKSCADINSTIRAEEIARLIRTFQIPASITNPVGLMIRTLPARCEPESLANYRERWREEDEQLARAREYDRREQERMAKRVLEDPEASESDREWAKAVLSA